LLQSLLNVALVVINKRFNRTMQKLSVKLSKGGPHDISENWLRDNRLDRLPQYPLPLMYFIQILAIICALIYLS